ncbi:MAG: hypothetical protein M1837_000645 [Sclerophora amabilis]|nr:MAG: hypothetical protein M1837_000645 [Sclerophora amabilis]
MKRIRPSRITGQIFSARPRPQRQHPCCIHPHHHFFRSQTTASSPYLSHSAVPPPPSSVDGDLPSLPSPPPSVAASSAKLSALHARLSLPSRFPLTTLSRALIDATADPSLRFNNTSLAQLGNNILGYYCSEHLLAHYPRLPTAVIEAATFAYIGPVALATVVREWGVETAAEPGGEVNPGLLQFRRVPPGSRGPPTTSSPYPSSSSSSSSSSEASSDLRNPHTSRRTTTTLERASTTFLRALVGAIYLHTGRQSTKQFVHAHILSRHLSLPSLFSFKQPTRDLSRLCSREGFASPIARLISETGRKSRHPVFVVGVYSGDDKLGEGQGSSLDEARTRAAVSALMAWYLYSPEQVTLPSVTEEDGGDRHWRPAMIDGGEVIV